MINRGISDWANIVKNYIKERHITIAIITKLIEIRTLWSKAKITMSLTRETETVGETYYDPNSLEYYKGELWPYVTNIVDPPRGKAIDHSVEEVMSRIIRKGFRYRNDE